MLGPFRWVGELAGVAAFAQRAQEVMWVLNFEADLDADFLAIYGIDLETYPITGPRYLALAHRLTAYQGVMAARVEEEREQTGPGPAAAVAEPQRATQAGTKEVTLTAFRMQFPGLVSMASSSGEGV